MKNKTYNKKKILVVFLCAVVMIFSLIGRLVYLMIYRKSVVMGNRVYHSVYKAVVAV